MKPREVVIIGGGLAGAAAATRLAQKGVDVLLLEKETQSHHKVCGEFLSYEAQHYLEQLGINLNSYGAAPIESVRLVQGKNELATPIGFKAMSLSRKCLDEAVLSRAKQAGADIKYGVNAPTPIKEIDCWHINRIGHDPIFAKTVFLATGKHDLRGWSQREGKQNEYIGFKMYFELTPDQSSELSNHVEITLFRGGYAGLEPVEGGQANLCLVVSKKQYASIGKKWDNLLSHMMKSTPQLAKRLTGAQAAWDKPLSIFGIPYGYVYQPSANDPAALYRLGDQMAVIPSLCGDGMAIALHCGFMAADCFMKTNAADYHQRMNRQLLGQINRATLLSKILASPFLQPLAVPLCHIMPKLVQSLVKQTRIDTALNELS
jgi:flavin-dependent dehydrogenase